MVLDLLSCHTDQRNQINQSMMLLIIIIKFTSKEWIIKNSRRKITVIPIRKWLSVWNLLKILLIWISLLRSLCMEPREFLIFPIVQGYIMNRIDRVKLSYPLQDIYHCHCKIYTIATTFKLQNTQEVRLLWIFLSDGRWDDDSCAIGAFSWIGEEVYCNNKCLKGVFPEFPYL